jgi:adenine-specific DNA-methyltransferase
MEDHSVLLSTYSDESPAVYADRVGRWQVASASPEHKKEKGQYLTPLEIARFMARLHGPMGQEEIRILDPGAGAGILACALCESLVNSPNAPKTIYVEAYENDLGLKQCLNDCLQHAQEWTKARGVKLEFNTSSEDFVMAYGDLLTDSPPLFSLTNKVVTPFDIAISNPPYFKIPKSDKRAQIAAAIVHGQPNIYAIFLMISALLLRRGGYLIAITPRSYATGLYFRLFRKKFFAKMRPEFIHVFHSRRDAFSRDDVLQENVILAAQRIDGWISKSTHALVKVSYSYGKRDLSRPKERWIPVGDVLDWCHEDKIFRIPATDKDDVIRRIVRAWDGDFRKYGLEISTGPIVPFRATSVVSSHGQVPQTHAPLLWMQNVTPMCIKWPVNEIKKQQFVVLNPTAMPLLIPNKNYVLLRRFSSKEQSRRLIAAPLLAGQLDTHLIGLENHLNYIHRPGSCLSEEEAYGLAVLLNSELLDTYFRIQNGNTQVSATELRAMPLPPLLKISEIGRVAMHFSEITPEILDNLVSSVLEIDLSQTKTPEIMLG